MNETPYQAPVSCKRKKAIDDDARMKASSARTDAVLVVDVVDLLQAEAFLVVEQLFFFQNALVEELLQLFVAVTEQNEHRVSARERAGGRPT